MLKTRVLKTKVIPRVGSAFEKLAQQKGISVAEMLRQYVLYAVSAPEQPFPPNLEDDEIWPIRELTPGPTVHQQEVFVERAT